MPYPKQHYLDKRMIASFAIKRKNKIAFDEKCTELGVSKSEVVDQLIERFLTGVF